MGRRDEVPLSNTGAVRVICRKSYVVSDQYRKMASCPLQRPGAAGHGDMTAQHRSLKMASGIRGMMSRGGESQPGCPSLQKLLGRGGRKIRRPGTGVEAVREKEGAGAERGKEEPQTELELKRMRSARKGSDHALVKEGMADEAYIRGYRRYRGIGDDYGPVPMVGVRCSRDARGMDVCGQVKLAGESIREMLWFPANPPFNECRDMDAAVSGTAGRNR